MLTARFRAGPTDVCRRFKMRQGLISGLTHFVRQDQMGICGTAFSKTAG
jgi:hypothetical protein